MNRPLFIVFILITCLGFVFAQTSDEELAKEREKFIIKSENGDAKAMMNAILTNQVKPEVSYINGIKPSPIKRKYCKLKKKHKHEFSEEPLRCPECGFNFTADGLEADQQCPDCGAIPEDDF